MMKRWLCIVIVVSMFSCMPLFSYGQKETAEDIPVMQSVDYVEGQALVKFSGESSENDDGSHVKLFSGRSHYETEVLMEMGGNNNVGRRLFSGGVENVDGGTSDENSGEVGQIALVTSDTLSTKELISKLEKRSDVEYAEPNYVFQLSSLSDDTYIDRQWHLSADDESVGYTAPVGAAKIDSVWSDKGNYKTGENAEGDIPVVAVVDSGVDYEHPDLADIMWDDGEGNCGEDFSSSEEIFQDGPMDYYGHGTHVAGIIGAQHNNGKGVSGMNKQVKLMALKVSTDGGAFSSDAVVRAYNYILEKKAEGVNIIAANNSWGGYYHSRIYEELIDLIGEKGIVTVAASGNESLDHDTNLNAPEGSDKTMYLMVNAADKAGKAADFSDYGLIDTDLYAQGMDIYSTYPELLLREGNCNLEDSDTVLWYDDLSSAPDIVEEISDTAQVMPWVSSGELPAPKIEYMSVPRGTLKWTMEPVKQGDTYGIQWNMGKPSETFDIDYVKVNTKYLALYIGSTDTAVSRTERYVRIYIKCIDGTWLEVTNGSAAVNYGTADGHVSIELTAEDKDKIDWENFTVRIGRKATSYDVTTAKKITFELEKIALLSDIKKLPYAYMDGTSVAAPVVTGAVALLYDYYNVAEKGDEEQKESLAEIRARIAGGVTRTEEMESRCASGGYLDLEKAVMNPYPVLDSFRQEGSTATITGYFFGNSGVLTIDGNELEVSKWSDREITFELPAKTSAGMHEFRVTDTSEAVFGTMQYGRDKFQVEAVEEETGKRTFFERLETPDFEVLGIEHPVMDEYSYSIGAYDGKIYMTACGLYIERNGKKNQAILIYDETDCKWSVATGAEMTVDNEIQIVTYDDGVYFVEMSGEVSDTGEFIVRLKIYEVTEHGEIILTDDNCILPLSDKHSIVCDGRYIWFVGGRYLEGFQAKADSRVVCYDTENKSIVEKRVSLKNARYEAAAEIIEGKLVVTGGINEYGSWERSTEVIDLKTGKYKPGADFPAVDETQQNVAASGQFDTKMIVSGMLDTKENTADTYVYDITTDTWEILKQKLADTKVFLAGGTISGEYFYVYGITLDGGTMKDVFLRLKVRELYEEETETEKPDREKKEDLKPEQPQSGEKEIKQEKQQEKKRQEGQNKEPQNGGHSAENGNGNENINSGDSSHIDLWVVLIAMSAIVAVWCAVYRKPNN